MHGREGRSEQLYLHLPGAGRHRAARHGRKPRGRRIPPERGIACRPAEVAARASFDHWEGDLLIFARGRGPANVTTLLERRSCFLVLLANPDRRPTGVAGRIDAALDGLDAGLRRTVIFDRGFEFMGDPALDRSPGCTSYFYDPRSSW